MAVVNVNRDEVRVGGRTFFRGRAYVPDELVEEMLATHGISPVVLPPGTKLRGIPWWDDNNVKTVRWVAWVGE